MAGEFQHGLFGCFDNCTICIVTYFIPCYTAGKVAEKVGKSCILHALLMFVPIANLVCRVMIRGEVRDQHNIAGSVVKDCLSVWCCMVCSLCQEAQETNAFGSQSMVSSLEIERQ